MNQTKTLEKLVSLLGRSEHDPEVIAILTELGEKLPLKRPKSYDNGGYLLEDNKKKNRGYHIGVHYADELPFSKNDPNFKENELVLYNIQDILDKKKFKDTIFPFGITLDINKDEAMKLLGDYDDYDKSSSDWENFRWFKNNIGISLLFDEYGKINRLHYCVITEGDLKFIKN